MTRNLVQKFLENRCTPKEAEEVLEWLQTEEGEAFLTKKISEDKHHFFIINKADIYPELDSASLLSQIKEKRNMTGDLPPVKKASRDKRTGFKKQIRNNRKRLLPLAAAAVFIAIAVMIFNPLAENDFLEKPDIVYQVFETERGERKTVRLSDGSTVILNSESRLLIPENFSQTNRSLSLQGEAWFEVSRDDRHSFEVETLNSLLRVLGTSFVIKSHPDEHSTLVVVAEGKVSLESKDVNFDIGREQVISKNQRGVLISGQAIAVVEISDPEQYTGWKDGKLIFHNTPFGEVIKRLERWYDIECIITDPAIEKERFTSVFEDEPLRQVLDVIALSMDIEYEIKTQTVIFTND